ncbi:MAG: septum formation protein Maf [Candidatus Cloacimonetes bacterium]|nr:septum formation protein Maf [Candidatus Cloacimonadota bacterium]
MIHNLLRNKQVILASASPRRKEIFNLIGINALQMPAHIDEDIINNNPRKLVKLHAENKAIEIRKKVQSDYVIVAADTIVYLNNEVLGKPRNVYQAAEFLTRLSDTYHYVYTGVAIAYKHQLISDFEKTRVEFKPLSAQEIDEYIKTKEPLDKAGAYGIQGFGCQFIKRLSGCYFNVMGFPVSLFYEMLKKIIIK